MADDFKGGRPKGSKTKYKPVNAALNSMRWVSKNETDRHQLDKVNRKMMQDDPDGFMKMFAKLETAHQETIAKTKIEPRAKREQQARAAHVAPLEDHGTEKVNLLIDRLLSSLAGEGDE